MAIVSVLADLLVGLRDHALDVRQLIDQHALRVDAGGRHDLGIQLAQRVVVLRRRRRAADSALLESGLEEVKGLEEVREAGQILRAGQWPQFEYVGFVEGDDIGKGTVDVVVTEGFSGNIALKAAEGTARQLGQLLKREMDRSLIRRLGYLMARGAFRALSQKMDPRKSNGGVFLGLNGIVIKSHGGTDAEGFACAVDLGYDMVRRELLAKIGRSLTRHQREAVSPRAVGGAAS